jgi:hypothetical protein
MSSSSTAPATTEESEISENAIIEACARGDMAQLELFSRRGVCVMSREPLASAVAWGKLDVMRCLVNGLGADANQAVQISEGGALPLDPGQSGGRGPSG